MLRDSLPLTKNWDAIEQPIESLPCRQRIKHIPLPASQPRHFPRAGGAVLIILLIRIHQMITYSITYCMQRWQSLLAAYRQRH